MGRPYRLFSTYYYFIPISLFIFLFSFGCDRTDSPDSLGIAPGNDPEIVSTLISPHWAFESTMFHAVRVQLAVPEELQQKLLTGHTQHPDAALLLESIDNQRPPVLIELRDDGNTSVLSDAPGYLDFYSGDLAPSDLVYSARLNARFTPVEGEFLATFAIGYLFDTRYALEGAPPLSRDRYVDFLLEAVDTLTVGIIDITPTAMEYETYPFWAFQSDLLRTIRIVVDLPDYVLEFIRTGEIDPPCAAASIERTDGVNEGIILFALLDDGNTTIIDNPPMYQSNRSGDASKGDLVYTARINSLFSQSTGEYAITYAAGDLTDTEFEIPNDDGEVKIPTWNYATIADTFNVLVNEPPQIVSFNVPTELPAGFDEQVWEAIVKDGDSSEGDVVSGVRLHILLDDDDLKQLDFSSEDGESWTLTVDASLAAGLVTETYAFEVSTQDRCDIPAEPFTKQVWLENSAPLILNLESPDTVERPLEGVNTYEFHLEAADLQGLGDIAGVRYLVRQPPPAQDFISDPDYLLFDDGTHEDDVAGDGIYSSGFTTTSQNHVFGPYTFRFIVTDRANNESEPYDKVIEFVDYRGD